MSTHPQSQSPEGKHIVAIIGGACAGAEVAARLADHGVEVVVFDQRERPYGKIEEGLPRWHRAQRIREFGIIDRKLGQPGVHVVPSTSIGADIAFDDLVNSWGFSAVVLACGAWRDRPFPVEGADAFVGRGLVYQNDLMRWYNHLGEPGHDNDAYRPVDGALVVGGGLASVDVCKVHMFEMTRRAFEARGLEFDGEKADKLGLDKVLDAHDLTWEELGIEGVTLFYRRGFEDMPVMAMPKGASPEKAAKVRSARVKIIERTLRKYRFTVETLARPESLIVEADRVVGLVFRRMQVVDGQLQPTDQTFERRGPYVVSSIGSIPLPIEGVPMQGELIDYAEWDLGEVRGLPTVFGAGNVVTGKGNIAVSRRHGGTIGEHVAARLMGVGEGELQATAPVEHAAAHAEHVASALSQMAPPTEAQRADILARVAARQQVVGYEDYAGWISAHPARDQEEE
ncbi:MAG: FAD-dependent oxidoreductase [Bradymonadia bacterium]